MLDLDTIEAAARAGTADPPTVLALCAEVRRLTAALREHGAHSVMCPSHRATLYYDPRPPEPCLCGLDAARRGTPMTRPNPTLSPEVAGYAEEYAACQETRRMVKAARQALDEARIADEAARESCSIHWDAARRADPAGLEEWDRTNGR